MEYIFTNAIHYDSIYHDDFYTQYSSQAMYISSLKVKADISSIPCNSK